MTPDQRRILHFFDRYVFDWMRSDIRTALRERAFLLAALGLVTYTEVLGGFRTGRLREINQSRANFEEFLAFLGRNHRELVVPGMDVRGWVRNALVHEYFTRGESGIVYRPDERLTVLFEGARRLFNVAAYSDAFFEGARSYRDEMLDREDSPFIALFLQALGDGAVLFRRDAAG